jgi:gamma-glutamylaminecyclotransferase
MNQLVFVYGTLKEGFPNFATNRGTRLPGTFITKERFPFYLVGERFSPWLINSPGQGQRVFGQVFEVNQFTLEAMDKLERITEPDGYRRVGLEVELSSEAPTSPVKAFAYLKQPKHFTPSEVRLGPIDEYTLEHATLYRPRA